MKIIEIKIYSFNELGETEKEYAIENYRTQGHIDTGFIYDEVKNTVDAFHNIFGTEEGHRSWLNVRLSYNMDSDFLELKGLRLRTYLLNNFGKYLYKPKFIGSLESNNIYSHKRIKSKPCSNGNVFNPYYSGCQKSNCCTLTGWCYDDFLLEPMYSFINWTNPNYHKGMDFETLVGECFSSLESAIESEIEYRHSDDAIIEEIEANEIEFTEDGQIY